MILYMYIALGQGQTAPRGQSFDVSRSAEMSYQNGSERALRLFLAGCAFEGYETRTLKKKIVAIQLAP